MYDGNPADNIAEIKKILLKMPVAEFTYEPASIFAGKPILFESNSYDLDGNILVYIWNFSDGNTTVTDSPIIVHTFTTVGNYTVNLTIIDNDGLTNSTSKLVIVKLKGDFNYNGKLDVGDVAYVAYMLVGKIEPDLAADFNGNGRVDIGDLAKIAYYVLGKISEL